MSAPDVLDVIITSLFNVPVYQGYGRAIRYKRGNSSRADQDRLFTAPDLRDL
jgi:hypothetical protein